MANDVFANNMEVSCKAADGKSICAFPDVCFTPPQTPATPPGVPIPYPNTGMASDTTDGSRTVKISSKEVMLKNKSYYKKSTGDEAGCAPKKGFITSKNAGKVYFKAWSMNVKVEGENVVRHFDLTTHNHASEIGNESIPWLHIDAMAMSSSLSEECEKEKDNFKKACDGESPNDCIKRHADGTINSAGTSEAMCANPKCREARKCTLLPYSIKCCKVDGMRQTPHHLIPNCLLQGTRNIASTNAPGSKGYTLSSAPCCCVKGRTQTQEDHGKIHDATKDSLRDILSNGGEITYDNVKKHALKAHNQAVKDDNGQPACKADCLGAQLDAYFNSRSETGDANDINLYQKDGATSWKPKVGGTEK